MPVSLSKTFKVDANITFKFSPLWYLKFHAHFFPPLLEIILHFIYHYLIRKKCCLLGYVGQWWFYLSFYKKAIIKWFANAKEMISNQDHYINFIQMCHLGAFEVEKSGVRETLNILMCAGIIANFKLKKKIENQWKHGKTCENR